MAIFFFVVGLELKREIVAGELSNVRKAMLPIAAAIGGMLVPAAIYLGLNPVGEVHSGWGIPMATDIALALGVLYLLGDRVPLVFKVFLTALAIVDDRSEERRVGKDCRCCRWMLIMNIKVIQ